jgi:hypothetical protein
MKVHTGYSLYNNYLFAFCLYSIISSSSQDAFDGSITVSYCTHTHEAYVGSLN